MGANVREKYEIAFRNIIFVVLRLQTMHDCMYMYMYMCCVLGKSYMFTCSLNFGLRNDREASELESPYACIIARTRVTNGMQFHGWKISKLVTKITEVYTIWNNPLPYI